MRERTRGDHRAGEDVRKGDHRTRKGAREFAREEDYRPRVCPKVDASARIRRIGTGEGAARTAAVEVADSGHGAEVYLSGNSCY